MALLVLVLFYWLSLCFTTLKARAALPQTCFIRVMLSPFGNGWQWPLLVPCIKERRVYWILQSRSAVFFRSASLWVNAVVSSHKVVTIFVVDLNRMHLNSSHQRSSLFRSQRLAWMSVFQVLHLWLCPAKKASLAVAKSKLLLTLTIKSYCVSADVERFIGFLSFLLAQVCTRLPGLAWWCTAWVTKCVKMVS